MASHLEAATPTEARRAWLELEFPGAARFDDPSEEWRRLFSELLGTFFLVLVGAGGAVVAAKSGGAIERSAAVTGPGLMVMAIILFMGAISGAHLSEHGLTEFELDALLLLTHSPTESYELYALRIAYAPGHAGHLARHVKIADLDDHMHRPAIPGDPPYAWARRHIANAQHAQQRLA